MTRWPAVGTSGHFAYAADVSKSLEKYRARRDFSKTPEPTGGGRKAKPGNAYVIQKHAAGRLHYDFRLELDGVLKSWAVPEGPSLIAGKKRLAVETEDHPLEYGSFEGVIPKEEYGGGTVMIWDRGTWTPDFDPDFGYRKGHLKFHLEGEKLKGQWHLVRMARKPREKQDSWLLFKSDDEAARKADAPDILQEQPLSAATGRDLDEIAREQDRVWSSGQGEVTAPAQRKRRKKSIVDAATLPKAAAAPLPSFVEPCLPSAADKPPSGKDWVHEVKYDGYRVQARIESGKAVLLTRKGLDWTQRFGGLGVAVAALPVKSALIDAEVVVQTEGGIASFTALVEGLKAGGRNLVLYTFDLLYLDGHDLREMKLVERKAALAEIINAHGDNRIRFSDHIAGDGAAVFHHAGKLGLEGIVSKKASAPYRSGRVSTWLKVKTALTGPFVIAGFIPSTVAKNAIGSLVLAEHVGGKLVASGHVGSGFSTARAHELWQALDPLRTNTATVKDETAVAKGARWVKPELVAEIEYRSRTGSEVIRHATFRDLSDDKTPADVVRPKSDGPTIKAVAAPQVKLTNPSRLLWPEQGITKQGLADFYTEIADWILPHITDRPLSLLRCPEGVHEECFFQKHRWAGIGEGVRQVRVPDDDQPMLAIDDLGGLLALVQAGVLEIHPWGAKADGPERPDRITMDLDPGDGVPWQHTVEAALELRTRLSDMGLRSFVKTTGGKGLHVVVPIAPKADWDTIKSFAQSLAERMAGERPDRYIATMSKRQRHGRIYVDYLRNGMGATAIGAYSTRARPGAAVSTPLGWDELGAEIRANHFTVENLPNRLGFLDRDPWEGYLSLQQELPGAAGIAPREASPPKPAIVRAAPDDHKRVPLTGAVVPTRKALREYWTKVGADALEHLGRRPLRLVRHEAGETFYHVGLLPPLPASVRTITIEKREHKEGTRVWVDSVDGLIGLVEIGAIELHPWSATIDDIERPDTLVFGVDPGAGVEWPLVTEAAVRLRDILNEEGLESWPKLTGGKGLHVMVPVDPDLDWKEARAFCDGIAERLAATGPDRYVTTPTLSERANRIYLDCRPNGRGTTAVGVYSPRARRGFPVAAKVDWADVERGIRSDAFTIARPPSRGGTAKVKPVARAKTPRRTANTR
jgi:bifunctional non-homologous end joining protein LigD